MKNIKVEQLAKNQFMVSIDNQMSFKSYDSNIAEYDKVNGTLYLYGEMWNYSNTTRKYFKQFLETYTNIVYGTKKDFIKQIQENKNIIIL